MSPGNFDILFDDVTMTYHSLTFFTSAEGEVNATLRNVSKLSFLGQDWASLWVFGFIRLFDEVRAELVRDISRLLRFL